MLFQADFLLTSPKARKKKKDAFYGGAKIHSFTHEEANNAIEHG